MYMLIYTRWDIIPDHNKFSIIYDKLWNLINNYASGTNKQKKRQSLFILVKLILNEGEL